MRRGFISYKPFLLFLAVPFILMGCFAPANVPIQTLKPARINFPDSLFSAGILNASIVESDFFSEDDSTWYTNKNQFLENLTATELCFSLSEWLLNSPRFSMSELVSVRELPAYEYMDTIPPPFSPAEIMGFSEDYASDLLITLEYFMIEDLMVSSPVTINLSDPEMQVFSYYSDAVPKDAKLKQIHAHLRFYNALDGLALTEFAFRDTVLWLSSLSFSRQNEDITDEDNFFYEKTGQYIGEKLYEIIVPHWIEEERDYFWGSRSQFSRAYFMALNNEWKTVENLMLTLSKHKQAKIAAYANFNLAVSLEMQGKIIEAYQAAERASTLNPNAASLKYKAILEKRLTEKELIDSQIGH
jgi:hypothetical protein